MNCRFLGWLQTTRLVRLFGREVFLYEADCRVAHFRECRQGDIRGLKQVTCRSETWELAALPSGVAASRPR